MSRERYRRARLAGAPPFNRDAWATVVGQAIASTEARQRQWDVTGEPRTFSAAKPGPCPVGSIPVPEHVVLAAEAHIAELEMLVAEFQQLADDPAIAAATRERVQAKIESTRALLLRRLTGAKA